MTLSAGATSSAKPPVLKAVPARVIHYMRIATIGG
jgi:hypothetical protein